MTNFTIDITSDPICVFCYLGKRRLEKAIDIWHKTASKSDTFKISWKPYYLQPQLPAHGEGEGVDKMAKMTERMGKEEASFARERLLQMGGREGINFMFDGKVGATRDAHRLMEFAQKKSAEVGDKVVERLFHEFHEEGRNIADRDLLVMAGADAGCDEQEIRSYLESVEGAAEVDKVAQAARDKGIVGVPHFLIHGVHVLDGAQDTGDFLEVFSQVKEAEN